MSWRSRSFDITIVGGGPAGAICALSLARGGARVGLVHRAGYQFGGVELVSGRARRLIEQHCPDFSDQALLGVEINETISLWGTPEPVTWNAMCNPWGPGVAVERTPFDEALRGAAERAGALLLGGEIRGAEHRGGLWQLLLHDGATEHILKTPFLVLANGSRGRKLFGRKAVSTPAQFALMARVGTKAPEQRHALYLELGKSGWWYMLPNPAGGYFAGFCTDHTLANNLEKPLRDTFIRRLRASRLLAELLPDTLLDATVTGRPAGPRTSKEVTGDAWIAIGDAAFSPDPLSGEGIEFAIESSLLAVRVLLEGAQPAALHNYEDQIQHYAASHQQIRDMYFASAEIHAV